MQYKDIPNSITILRIMLIPVFALVFCLPFESKYIVAATIFIFAAITDFVDGYLARKWKQVSSLGTFLDPVADKLIVIVALILLVGEYGNVILTIPAAVIAGREIVVSALREWMAEMGKRASIKVSNLGKVKTAIQMIAIGVLLSQAPDFTNVLVIIGLFLLYLSAVLTLVSMSNYVKSTWSYLVSDRVKG